MSFLQSVIADARPRKSMPKHSDGPLATNVWKSRASDRAASATEAILLGAVEQTSHLSMSLPIRDRASEIILGNTPAVTQTDNLVNQDGLGTENNVESESLLSVPVDMGRPNPDEESYSHMDIGNLLDREPGSEGDKTSKAEGDLAPQPSDTVIQDGRTNSPTSQGNDFSIEFQDTHGLQNQTNGNEEIESVRSPAGIGETPTIQTGATQTTDFTSSESSRRIEPGVLGPSLVPAAPSPGTSGNPRLDAVAAATSQGTGADGDLQQPGESLVDDALGPLRGHTPTPSNPTWRNEAEKALADGGKADNVSPGDDKQADMKDLPNQEKIPRFQKPDEAKGTAQDVQLVSQHANAIAPRATKDIERAPISQSTGNKEQVSASSPASAANPPPSLEQPVARSAMKSASPEALRSVPATPFQTNPIPKAGDSFRSRPSLRPPEKKHEAPKVQIGQIDVIIETAAQSAPKPASAPATIDLASRHYLRRL